MRTLTKVAAGSAIVSGGIGATKLALRTSTGGQQDAHDLFCLSVFYWLVLFVVVEFAFCLLLCKGRPNCQEGCTIGFFFLIAFAFLIYAACGLL
jgi:hypothetical protein